MHLRKLGGALFAVLALAAVLAACGGGSSDSSSETTSPESTESTEASAGGSAPTKAQFIKEADKICGENEQTTNEEIVAYAKENNINIEEEPSEDQQLEIFEAVVIPKLGAEAEEVGALTPPEGEEATVEDLVETLNEEIGEIEDEPKLVVEGEALEGASKKAQAFGLKTCGN